MALLYHRPGGGEKDMARTTILISGAASGLGRAFLQAYARDPDNSIIAVDKEDINVSDDYPAHVSTRTVNVTDEASIKHLKRLVYNYRATSESAKYSIIWQSGMLYLINYILHDYTSKEAHFYFLLCMRGYQNMARTFPFIGGVVQGITAMAVQLGTILPEDAQKLFDEIESEGQRISKYMSTYPVDLYRSAEDSIPGTLEHLVGEFMGIANVTSEEPEMPEGWKGDDMSLFTTLLDEDDVNIEASSY